MLSKHRAPLREKPEKCRSLLFDVILDEDSYLLGDERTESERMGMIELHELLTRFGLEDPERPAGDRLIYSALVLKLERLRIGHAAAALHLEADIAAEILFIVVEVYGVARGDNFAVCYPLDDPAVAGRIGGDGYRVRFLVDFDTGHERHIAVAVKVADSVGGLVIFARGKEVAVFHRFF